MITAFSDIFEYWNNFDDEWITRRRQLLIEKYIKNKQVNITDKKIVALFDYIEDIMIAGLNREHLKESFCYELNARRQHN